MPKKKAIPAKAAAKEFEVVILEVYPKRSEDACQSLRLFLRTGWKVIACAATRSEGFNRDTLYYTLVK